MRNKKKRKKANQKLIVYAAGILLLTAIALTAFKIHPSGFAFFDKTTACCTLDISVSPKFATPENTIVVTADVPNVQTGEPAKPSEITTINISIYRVEGSSSYTLVDNEPMQNFIDGIWNYRFDAANRKAGNYIASVSMLPDSGITSKIASSTFSIGNKDSGLTIRGISPDLFNVNKSIRLAAQITLNGKPLNKSLIQKASLTMRSDNMSSTVFTKNNGLQITDGLIYLDGNFNETGYNLLEWQLSHNGINRSSKELVLLVSWIDKLQTFKTDEGLKTMISDTKSALAELISTMETLQEFSSEEVFLVTDSVKSITQIIKHIERGDFKESSAQKQAQNIKKNLERNNLLMTGAATSSDGVPAEVKPILSMEDWRTILFIVLLMIFALIIFVIVLLLKIINLQTIPQQANPLPKPKVSKKEKNMRRYQIILQRFKKKNKTSKNGKRRYEIILDKLKGKKSKQKNNSPSHKHKKGKR